MRLLWLLELRKIITLSVRASVCSSLPISYTNFTHTAARQSWHRKGTTVATATEHLELLTAGRVPTVQG